MNALDAILRFTYLPLKLFWQRKKIVNIQSNILIVIFILSMGLALLNVSGFIFMTRQFDHIYFLQAIEISFTLLLFFEIINLAFNIQQSIENSIGKQIEILIGVQLRSSSKFFSHFDFHIPVLNQLKSVYKMIADVVGSSILFLLLSVYYNIQQHRIVTALTDKVQFIIPKQCIAPLVCISLFFLETNDVYNFINTGIWVQSIDPSYMILIFADLLFMLVVFRYILHHPNVLRYAAFIMGLVFIRLSLRAPVYYNALLALFAKAVAHTHHVFTQGRLNHITKKIILHNKTLFNVKEI